MGILNLNKFIQKSRVYKYGEINPSVVVIDGSNYLFSRMMSRFAKLKAEFSIENWKSVDIDLLFQTKYLVENVSRDLVYKIRNIINMYTDVSVYFVMDPFHGKPLYHIDSSMKYNEKYISVLVTNEELENGIDIDFKSEEQQKRKNARNHDDINIKHKETLRSLIQDSSDYDLVNGVYDQSTWYNTDSRFHVIKSCVLAILSEEFKDRNLVVVAEDEADLVIKNIAVQNQISGRDILIMSRDTDYFALFADIPEAYWEDFATGNVYNPYTTWSEYFGEYFSYELIIRLCPVFGNDYTVKERIISCENFEDVLTLIESHTNNKCYKSLNKIKSLYKVLEKGLALERNEDICLYLDDLMHNYSDKYFLKYYSSVLIYENWNKYNRYSILSMNPEIEKQKMIEYLLSNTSGIILKWNSDGLYFNWPEFIDSIIVKMYEDVTSMRSAYDELPLEDEM